MCLGNPHREAQWPFISSYILEKIAAQMLNILKNVPENPAEKVWIPAGKLVKSKTRTSPGTTIKPAEETFSICINHKRRVEALETAEV